MLDFDTVLSNNSLLGKSTPYINQYDNTLICPIPRTYGREALALNGTLPFLGKDIWNAYEVAYLDKQGKPQHLVLQITYGSDSEFLVESKSLKLYLNSFNLTRLDSTQILMDTIAKDLSSVLKTEVSVDVIHYLYPTKLETHFSIYEEHECIDELPVEISEYHVNPHLLKLSKIEVNGSSSIIHEKLVSHLFKSNCPCTHLPDFASVFIEYSGKAIDKSALLAYLISYREHQSFHEQCVEKIFSDLMAQLQPESLMVYARFTRRGGLDINPYRYTPNLEKSISIENLRTLRQ